MPYTLNDLPAVFEPLPQRNDFTKPPFPPFPGQIKGSKCNPIEPADHGFQCFKFRDQAGAPVHGPDGRSSFFIHPVVAQRLAHDNGWSVKRT